MALTERTPSWIIYVDSNGVSHNVKAVYRGSTKVRPEWGWTPWANTIAYYPFNSDLLDYSGNNNNWTYWAWTFANNMVTTTSSLWRNALITSSQDFTLSAYADFSKTTATAGYAYIAIFGNSDWPTAWFWINRTSNEFAGFKTFSWHTFTQVLSSSIHHLVLTRSGSIWKAYADWVLIGTQTDSWSLQSSTSQTIGSPSGYNYSITCGEVIMESVARTDQEVADYYNSTKSNYGIS